MSGAMGFWEKRRAGVRAEEQAALRAEADAEAQTRQAELDGMEDDEALRALDLPDPNALEPGDDFSVFMRPDVPEKFRKLALRRLWRSNPVLANVDGLNEYDDDYRAEALGQVVKTAYQVGKGMMAHVEEMQRQAEAAEQGAERGLEDDRAELTAAPEAQDLTSDAFVDPAAPKVPDETAETQVQGAVQQAGDDAPVDVAMRRMRFQFEEVAP